jgi:mono/diheme cytochrome c family protein
MKKLLLFAAFTSFLLVYACGNGEQSSEPSSSGSESSSGSTASGGNSSYDTARGEGKFKNVEIAATLDQSMATAGENVYNLKCSSCHKLSGEKLVGPGWKGVTQRHKPEWIMNFVTNTDEMLAKDPKAQAQLEICLVRMPNQNVSDEAARQIYEFMRKNDGVK